jgi:hypothetical protein
LKRLVVELFHRVPFIKRCPDPWSEVVSVKDGLVQRVVEEFPIGVDRAHRHVDKSGEHQVRGTIGYCFLYFLFELGEELLSANLLAI